MQLPFDLRENKGYLIAEKNEGLKRIDEHSYLVNSESGKGEYEVHSGELGWICECPDHVYRASKCKHIWAVEFSLKIRLSVLNHVVIPELNVKACLYCGSESIIQRGIRHNQSGDLQRYLCKSCGKRFSFNLGFEKMKATPQIISSAMQLYFTGESLRNVKKFLRLQGVRISHVSVLKWIRKYIELMDSYLDKIHPKVSDTWRPDELYLKIKGNKSYLFAVLDDESRYWIAQQIADHKGVSDLRPMFREARQIAEKQPKKIISDGARNFGQAIRDEYQRNERVLHIADIRLDGSIHNNKMERFNGEQRDREKVMRSLKRKDSPVLKGMQIYHNFVRPHMALGNKTPAEKCGIKVEGRNKWMTLIQNATLDARKAKNYFDGI